MRISTGMIASRSLANVSAAYERLAVTQEQMATGKRINRPSDDPTGTHRTLDLNHALGRLSQYQQNATDAQAFLGSTDAALTQAANLLRQARALAIQGASDTLDEYRRAGFVPQLQSVIDGLAGVANTAYGTRRIFAGQRTTEDPFVQDTSGRYRYAGGTTAAGDDDLAVDVGPGEPMVINRSGDSLFAGAFDTLMALRDHLGEGDVTAISKADLKALDDALAVINEARADVGARVQRLKQLDDAYTAARTHMTENLSKMQDIDIAQVVVEFQTAQVTYNGALSATKMGFQQSLLDFLR